MKKFAKWLEKLLWFLVLFMTIFVIRKTVWPSFIVIGLFFIVYVSPYLVKSTSPWANKEEK